MRVAPSRVAASSPPVLGRRRESAGRTIPSDLARVDRILEVIFTPIVSRRARRSSHLDRCPLSIADAGRFGPERPGWETGLGAQAGSPDSARKPGRARQYSRADGDHLEEHVAERQAEPGPHQRQVVRAEQGMGLRT